jgi:hypothetical protein
MSALFSQLPNGGGLSVALSPVNLASAAANSLYANIANVNKALLLLVFLKAGGSGENVTINLQQATDAAGTGAKTLNIKEVFFKKGATTFATAPNTNDKFARSPSTPVNRETAIASYATATDRVAATNDFMALIRISPADLDMANGFRYVRAQFTDPGATEQLGMALWIPDGAAYLGDSAPSILA